jgi:hypothetical protein
MLYRGTIKGPIARTLSSHARRDRVTSCVDIAADNVRLLDKLRVRLDAENQWRSAIVLCTNDAEPGTIVALNDSAIAIRWDETGI